MLAVVDIDGVVADVRHRLHHLQRRRWDLFFAAAGSDALLPEGARLVADLGRRFDVVWLSGRPEWLRAVTGDWLRSHGLPDAFMELRPDGDYRPAAVFKLDVLARLGRDRVGALVDDDDEVIGAARAAGYPAVLADWVPRSALQRRAQDRDGRA